MKYIEVVKAHKTHIKQYPNEPNDLYNKVINNKNIWKDLVILYELYHKWNPRVHIGKIKFKNTVMKGRRYFRILGKKKLENFKFTKKNKKVIKTIYEILSNGGLKYTGTSKVMHFLNPKLFVMWDMGIRRHYDCWHNSEGYINFLKNMKEEVKGLLSKIKKEDIEKKLKRPLLKLVDEYNWKNFRTSKKKY